MPNNPLYFPDPIIQAEMRAEGQRMAEMQGRRDYEGIRLREFYRQMAAEAQGKLIQDWAEAMGRDDILRAISTGDWAVVYTSLNWQNMEEFYYHA